MFRTEDKGETMLKSLKISTLTLAIGLAAGSLHAAGLGRLSVQSSLGQPLRAEIELLAVQPEELGTVVARLAGAEAFRQARLDRADVLGALQFSIDQRNGARPVVRITSSQPVNEPFLDLLIELGWSSGRILREYTVLLDPPADARPEARPAPRLDFRAAAAGRAIAAAVDVFQRIPAGLGHRHRRHAGQRADRGLGARPAQAAAG